MRGLSESIWMQEVNSVKIVIKKLSFKIMVVSGPIEVVLVLFLVSGGVAWWLLLEQRESLYLCMLLTRAEVYVVVLQCSKL